MPKPFPADHGLNKTELKVFKKLNTPAKIQDFLDTLDFNFDPGDKIDRSVRVTLKSKKTDCAGGAIFAAAVLWANGQKPLLVDLKASPPDVDHVMAVYKVGNHFGAISKTNHAVLRYREPVYRSLRELCMSFFHEYFLPNGKKTLRSFSKPMDLSKYGTEWLTDPDKVMDIIWDLDHFAHVEIATRAQIKKFRKADAIEIKAGKLTER